MHIVLPPAVEAAENEHLVLQHHRPVEGARGRDGRPHVDTQPDLGGKNEEENLLVCGGTTSIAASPAVVAMKRRKKKFPGTADLRRRAAVQYCQVLQKDEMILKKLFWDTLKKYCSASGSDKPQAQVIPEPPQMFWGQPLVFEGDH